MYDQTTQLVTPRLSTTVLRQPSGSNLGLRESSLNSLYRCIFPATSLSVGIAAAPDFTDWGFDAEQKALLRGGDTLLQDNPYGPEPTPTYAGFWQDGESRRLLDAPIALDCPVRLIHGMKDADVPKGPERVSIFLGYSERHSSRQGSEIESKSAVTASEYTAVLTIDDERK